MTKEIEEFSVENQTKQSGVTEGFIKVHKTEGASYMFKPILKEYDEERDFQKETERSSALLEFTFGKAFKELLKDQAPEICLVTDRSSTDRVFMASKFLEAFSPINVFIRENPDRISEIDGLEKVVIASLYLGDSDLNPGNVGIISQKLDNGAHKYVACKIDHGSAGSIPQEENLQKSIDQSYSSRNYAQNLPLDQSKIRTAIQEIIDIDISDTIKERVDILGATGVDTKYCDVFTCDEKELIQFSEYLNARKMKLAEFGKTLGVESSKSSDLGPDSENLYKALDDIKSRLAQSNYVITKDSTTKDSTSELSSDLPTKNRKKSNSISL
jgi:hypothetical protein